MENSSECIKSMHNEVGEAVNECTDEINHSKLQYFKMTKKEIIE